MRRTRSWIALALFIILFPLSGRCEAGSDPSDPRATPLSGFARDADLVGLRETSAESEVALASADKGATTTSAGETWCRYQAGGKIVFEQRCSFTFDPNKGCDHSVLEGRYTLVFSEKSRATVTSTCGSGTRDAVNGVTASIDSRKVNGRTFYEATLETGEILEFEARNGNLSTEMPPWSPRWLDLGLVGTCAVPNKQEVGCIKIEQCSTGGEAGEGGCEWEFRAAGSLLYTVSNAEEAYVSEGETFFSDDIKIDENATCYPISKSLGHFCFSTAESVASQVGASSLKVEIANNSLPPYESCDWNHRIWSSLGERGGAYQELQFASGYGGGDVVLTAYENSKQIWTAYGEHYTSNGAAIQYVNFKSMAGDEIVLPLDIFSHEGRYYLSVPSFAQNTYIISKNTDGFEYFGLEIDLYGGFKPQKGDYIVPKNAFVYSGCRPPVCVFISAQEGELTQVVLLGSLGAGQSSELLSFFDGLNEEDRCDYTMHDDGMTARVQCNDSELNGLISFDELAELASSFTWNKQRFEKECGRIE